MAWHYNKPIGFTKGDRKKSASPVSTINLDELRSDFPELCAELLTTCFPLTVLAARAVVLSNADLRAWVVPANDTTLALIRAEIDHEEVATSLLTSLA